MPVRIVAVLTVYGRPEAELLRSFLQAQGVPCELSQEAAGWLHGLTVGPMAEVELLVPEPLRERALELIDLYRRGEAPVAPT